MTGDVGALNGQEAYAARDLRFTAYSVLSDSAGDPLLEAAASALRTAIRTQGSYRQLHGARASARSSVASGGIGSGAIGLLWVDWEVVSRTCCKTRCCMRDDGRSIGAALWEEASNCRKRLRSKGVVVNVSVKSVKNTSSMGWRVERKRTSDVGIETTKTTSKPGATLIPGISAKGTYLLFARCPV